MNGGLSSSHVNKVHENVSASDKCKYCGKNGHGKHPSSNLRKDSCPAFEVVETKTTHTTVVSTTHATEPEEVFVMVGVEENVKTTVLLPVISSSQTRVGGAEVLISGVHLQQGHNLPAHVGVGGAPEGGAEVVPGAVNRPVLPRGSGGRQFNTFKLNWVQNYRAKF